MTTTRLLLLALLPAFFLSWPAAAASRTGELRGLAVPSSPERDWTALAQSLKENGFNGLFPKLSGGTACYASKVLPPAGAPKGKDQVAEALKAAKAAGLEVHVGRTVGRLEGVSPEVLKQYEAEGRLMRDSQGRLARETDPGHVDWLCPSHPKNRKLEREAVLELVRKYDLAGIQLDSLRFPSADYCFCDTCKAEFKDETSLKLEQWPAEVVKGGRYALAYEQWRERQLTSLLQEISEAAHLAKPALLLSLTTFADPDRARREGLQDWPAWVGKGGLDFICFEMDTTNQDQFRAVLAPALARVGGHFPVYVTLGTTPSPSAATLINEVTASRAAGADGFVIAVSEDVQVQQWLPRLRADVTSSDPGPLPHAGPPTIMTLTGPAVPLKAPAGQMLAGQKLTVALVLGVASEAEADAEGAAAAGDVLRQARDARRPVDSYEAQGSGGVLPTGLELSGQAVVESPSGDPLLMLGVFSGTTSVKTAFTFTVPSGPFRVAIYGEQKTPDAAARAFVIRSVLLTGVVETPVATAPAPATHDKLSSLMSKFVARIRPEDIADLNLTTQFNITGEGGGDWWVTAKEGKVDFGEGVAKKADITLSCCDEDALGLCTGELDPTTLLATGRLSLSGDLLLMRKLLPLLQRMSGG